MATRKKTSPPPTTRLRKLIVMLGFVILGTSITAAWVNRAYFIDVMMRDEGETLEGSGSTAMAATAPPTGTTPPLSSSKTVSTFYDITTEPVGEFPEKWRVEQAEGVTVKTKPVKFSNDESLSFVAPAYQLIPITVPGGIYVIEPGRADDGTGATIPDVIDRFSSEAQAMRDMLRSLDNTLEELGKLRKAEQKPTPN